MSKGLPEVVVDVLLALMKKGRLGALTASQRRVLTRPAPLGHRPLCCDAFGQWIAVWGGPPLRPVASVGAVVEGNVRVRELMSSPGAV